jgi:diguanylate cyclase
MKIQGSFLASQLARRIFFGVFSLALVVLLLLGGVFYQLGSQLVRSASTKVLDESARAFGRNLLDRLTSGEALLTQMAWNTPTPKVVNEIAVDASLQRMFSSIRIGPMAPGGSTAAPDKAGPSRVDAIPGTHFFPDIVLTVRPAGTGTEMRAVFNAEYIWDSAQSGLFSLCMQTSTQGQVYCENFDAETAGALQVRRSMLFRPFFEAAPWTLTATASAELTQLLPFGVGYAAVAICILAFLLALMSTSIYLRKLTRSLNALMTVTRNVSARDFSKRVPMHALRGELHELGSAFNQMTSVLDANHRFQIVLSEIDACILTRRPLEDAIHTGLSYANRAVGESRVYLRASTEEVEFLYTSRSDGTLTIVTDQTDPAQQGAVEQCPHIDLGQAGGRNLQLEVYGPQGMQLPAEIQTRLCDLGKKLAIAADASAHERHLSLQATTDSLTGLFNRYGYMRRLGELIEERTWGECLAVVFCDLDGFKEVNDAYGHSMGDALLRALAGRMETAMGQMPCVLARLGGDEFACIFRERDLALGVGILRNVLAEPTVANNRSITLSASLGSACYPADGESQEELLRKADLAMYKSKAEGRNVFYAYTQDLEQDVAQRLELIRDLRGALASDALQIYYQPRASAGSHAFRSAEALMRWRHPTRGWVSPAVFIPLAEQTGMIGTLGEWILDRACQQMKQWQAQGLGIEQISVNVSPVQMKSAEFFDRASKLMHEHGLPPGSIELEITEGALVENVQDTAPKLRALQAAGYHIALDDFGVGYSALSYLSRIPFDTLKIDQSFVSAMHDDVSHAIVKAIVTLAQAMHKHMVAEGVEREEQCEALQQLGVQELQGYFFGKPMPAELLTEQLQQQADSLGLRQTP